MLDPCANDPRLLDPVPVPPVVGPCSSTPGCWTPVSVTPGCWTLFPRLLDPVSVTPGCWALFQYPRLLDPCAIDPRLLDPCAIDPRLLDPVPVTPGCRTRCNTCSPVARCRRPRCDGLLTARVVRRAADDATARFTPFGAHCRGRCQTDLLARCIRLGGARRAGHRPAGAPLSPPRERSRLSRLSRRAN